jgi:hypothetical protein
MTALAYPRPVLIARDGVRLDGDATDRDMSRSTVTDRDALDLDAIDARMARDPEFLAALLSRIEGRQPAPAPAAPFNSSAATVTSGAGTDSGLSPGSDSLIAKLLESLSAHRDLVLFWVTLTCPGDPRKPLGTLLALYPGAWGVLEARRDRSLHAHALILLPSRSSARELVERWCLASGGSPAGQNARQVSGWSAFAVKNDAPSLARNLARIVAYAGKDPVEGFAVGALAEVPMLSRSPAMSAPTVTGGACLCGCGKPASPRSKYAAPACGARLRQRRARGKLVTVSGDSSPTVTPSKPVTLARDTAPTVTADSLDDLKRATTALEILAPMQVEEHARLRGELQDLVRPYLPAAFLALDLDGPEAPTAVLLATMRLECPDADPAILAEALEGIRALYVMFEQHQIPADERQQFLKIALREAGGARP